MKRTLTFIFGLILMVVPFVPTLSIADAPSTVTVSGPYTINGIIMDVTSSTPTPIIGAAIAIPGTAYGTTSDANGKFKFRAPLNAEHITLVITYVGWTNPRINLQEYCNTEETKAKCNHTAKTIDIGTIELREESQNIDEVVKVFDINCPQDTLNSLNAKKGMMITNDDGTQAPCLPTECNQNYILMNSITYDKITSTTQYGALKAANPKCVPESNCHTKNTGVKSSRYELQSNNKYQCIAECHDGYAPNTQDPSTCDKVPDCTKEIANAKRAEYTGSGTNRKCVVKECKCGFDVNSDKTGCTTWDSSKCSNRTKIRGAKRMQRFCDNETEVCTALECDTENYKKTEVTGHNYRLPSNISKLYTCEEHAKQCTDEQLRENASNLQHASKSKPITNTTKTDGSQICIPTKCECGYDLTGPDTPDAKCTEWGENELCLERPENAADNQYFRRCRNNQEYCYINDCTDGYLPNEDNDRCVLDRKSGECTPDNNNNVRYAKWRKEKGKYVCIIIECVRGYERNAAGTECIAKMVLPEGKSAERINELQDVYNDARANETSTANKLLGGASMGATGAGGMMLGMGLAEQKADNAAYEQMRGYVSTFKCNYGGNNIEYSVEPTQLPTSTELTNLYAEYVTLANDLKMRKSALGLRAGLESQPILDSATSGLYDDVSSGRATGTFTSLARAILDPNGEDAKRWAEQTKKSKNLIIAGGVTAGVGAVGGIVGNTLINKDTPNLQSVREDINDINKKYEEFATSADDLNTQFVQPEPVQEEENEVQLAPIADDSNPPQSDEEPVVETPVEDTTNETEKAGKITLTIPTGYVIDDQDIDDDFIPDMLRLFSYFKATTDLPEPIDVTVDVYTDTDGDENKNLELSRMQATNIRNKLLFKARTQGPRLTIKANGYGEKNCTCAAGLNNQKTIEMRFFRSERTDEKLCGVDSTYAELANKKIPGNTKFWPCNRIEFSITVPDIESFKYNHNITGFDPGDPVILPYWDDYGSFWITFP